MDVSDHLMTVYIFVLHSDWENAGPRGMHWVVGFKKGGGQGVSLPRLRIFFFSFPPKKALCFSTVLNL